MANKELTKKERQKRAQRRRRQASGLFFILLALVGAGTIVFAAVRYIGGLLDDSEARQDYQQLIAPLVALDPEPFESLGEADGALLLESAIWAALDYEDTSKYERNEAGSILLPTVDVERYYSAMYGPSAALEHRSFTDEDIEFLYLSDTSCYVIPITSQSNYHPLVESISGSGSTRVLRVAYLTGSTSAVELIEDASAQIVVKYMDYIMTRERGSFYISGVREVSNGGDSGQSAQNTQTDTAQ
ncbi:MAG: hypothetical protein Q4B42_01745 [Oscillospiraceae bacterium]|nr:hypothetical protein [Oscillospiraceae bacterium]